MGKVINREEGDGYTLIVLKEGERSLRGLKRKLGGLLLRELSLIRRPRRIGLVMLFRLKSRRC